MKQVIKARRALSAFSILLFAIQFSGCATGSGPQQVQTSSDLVDVCHTQATHTSCYRERIADLENDMNEFHERQEMAELDDLGEW